YVRVGSKHGMSWLATLKSARHQGRERVIGSALLVRADSSYESLDDLYQAKLGAVDPLAFGGFQIYWGEMVKQGHHPEAFFSEIKFSGFPVGALAFWVRDGLVDAAVLPACLLEKLSGEGILQAADYRVIEPRAVAKFDCLTSTDLYPNWSFSKLRPTSADIAEQVARALLQLPADSIAVRDAGALGWTAPVSSYDIHQLYQQLKIHPWQQPWWQSVHGWLLRNWHWSLAILLLMVAGLCHHLWVQWLVHKRTRELHQVNQDMQQQQQLLEHAQRVAILGELSSDLAHELNQPLAAINSYAEGGIVRIDPAKDDQGIAGLLGRISREAQRGASIIERIRGFARRDSIKRTPTDLRVLVRETLSLLDYELKKYPLDLHLQLPEKPVVVAVDGIQVQQLLVNLIRNAMEAMTDAGNAYRLRIAVSDGADKRVLIEVEDSGAGLGDIPLQTLMKPFYSTKPEGLGLGMAICKRIVEAHGGDIAMQPGSQGGTCVSCWIAGVENDG
ncbi:MAG: ATP-binding protein, partial [Motiliproteus sp.]